MKDIKILLLCNGRFALPAMRDMVFANQLAVVGIPAHCEEMLEEVKLLLSGTDIPVLQLDRDSFEEQLKKAMKKYEISMGFVMTFSYKISSSLYRSLPVGFFNVHPGPLPQYRGADPIFQQIKNRDKHAGVTVHKLADKIDAGDIVITEMIKTDPRDTYGLLNLKLAELAAKLTGTVIRMAGFDITIHSRPQDESKAQYFKKQSSKDITIKWEEMDAATIIALINACNPWNKGAVTRLKHKIIRIVYAEKTSEETAGLQISPPGIITAIYETGITVSTINNGLLKIEFIYIDEGFLPAGRLGELGFIPGNRFQTI